MIRCRDMAEDRASLELRCRQCGKVVLIPGPLLVRRYGPEAALSAIVARMRCDRDGMIPDARIRLPSDAADREAGVRRLPIHAR